MSFNIKQRIMKFITIPNENGCMIWTGRKHKSGYGQIKIINKMYLAHRLSYKLFNGEITDNLCVLHKCDNRICVAPNHLFLGTKSDNMLDMYNKNRHLDQKLENNGNAKLTSFDVIIIRLALLCGYAAKFLSKNYSVNSSMIYHIKNKRNWNNIKEI